MVVSESIKDDNYKVKQISRLLESGGAMLAQHCNVCGAPFFRYHGEILCPVCSTFGEQPITSSKEASNEEKPVSASSQSSAATTSPAGVESTSSKEVSASVKSTELQKPAVNDVVSSTVSTKDVEFQYIKKVLLLNIEDIALKLVGESDISKLAQRLDLIERTLTLAERVKKI